MAQICADGLMVSDVHLLILAEFLLDNGQEWATKGLQGIISKATNVILRDYLEVYKATQTDPVSTQLSVLMPAILGMQSFIPYEVPTPSLPNIDCGRPHDIQLWPNGFTIQDYELTILQAYFANCEDYMRAMMVNKIYNRGMTFVKEIEAAWQDDPAHPTMPVCMADVILAYTSEPGYLNRAQREAQQ